MFARIVGCEFIRLNTDRVAYILIMVLNINNSSTWATLDLCELSDAVTEVTNPEEHCATSIEVCETALNDYRPTTNVVVVGRSGEGKSALINSLIGKEVCEEGDTKATTAAAKEPIVVQVNGYDLKIFDTQGAFDGEDQEEYIFESMHDVKIDLLIVCVSMVGRVQSRDTRDTISLLTKKLGIEIWERAIVVLTMANERAEKIARKEGEDPTPYNDVVDQFSEQLRIYLSRGRDEQGWKVPLSVMESTPIIPAGKHDKRTKDWRKLPDCDDWLSRFWVQCYERCSLEKGGAFLGMAEDCLLLHSDDGSVETLQQNLESTLRSSFSSSPGSSSRPCPGPSARPRPSSSAGPRPDPSSRSRPGQSSRSRQSASSTGASSDPSSSCPKIHMPKKKLQWGTILKSAIKGANASGRAAITVDNACSRFADKCEEGSRIKVILKVASKLIEMKSSIAGGIIGAFVGFRKMIKEY